MTEWFEIIAINACRQLDVPGPSLLGAMRVRLRSEQIAGLLSFLAALLAGVATYIYLFVANPSGRPPADSVYSQFASALALENADRWWSIWCTALPLALTMVGAAYLSRLARKQAAAVLLLTVLVILAGLSFYLTDWTLAIFVALPIFWGWRCVRGV
jgi:hypothetical protein